MVGIDILEPAKRRQNIRFAIAVDIGNADAMAILLLAAHMMHLGLSPGKINPDHARMVVVRQRDIRLAIAVDVRLDPALGVDSCR